MEQKTLTKSFKKDIEDKLLHTLGEPFTAIKILGYGSQSIAVLVENSQGNQFVYKGIVGTEKSIARLKQKIKKFKTQGGLKDLKHLKSRLENLQTSEAIENQFIDALQDKYRETNSQIFIPKSYFYSDFTLEPYAGETLTLDVLNANKNKITNELAHLYATIHKGVIEKPSSKPIFQKYGSYIPKILLRYDSVIPQEITDKVKQAIEELAKLGNNDEYRTTIHGDLRLNNLCFSQKKNQLAVIDWQLARLDNIYAEFLTSAQESQKLPFDFIYSLVDKYNEMSEIKVDKHKLKLLQYVGIFDEYGRVAIFNYLSTDEFQTLALPKLIEKFTELDSLPNERQ